MKRTDEKYQLWAEQEVTQEVFAAARENIVRALEVADLSSAEGRDAALELVRRLQTVRAMKAGIAKIAGLKKLEDALT